MKLALMQPYLFPYIGYFDLISQVDQWIVFDTVQYIRSGWVNRNRVLHPVEGWQYITVPIRRHSRQTAIQDIQIVDINLWRAKLFGQLQHYKKKAPFYNAVMDVVNECISENCDSLCHLNVRCLDRVCAYLGIPFLGLLLSAMNLELGPIRGPDDWALRISEKLGASEYVNAPGGADLYNRSKFEEAAIKLTIQTPVDFAYACEGYKFQPNLSIIDVMMWNSKDSILEHLHKRQTKRYN